MIMDHCCKLSGSTNGAELSKLLGRKQCGGNVHVAKEPLVKIESFPVFFGEESLKSAEPKPMEVCNEWGQKMSHVTSLIGCISDSTQAHKQYSSQE